MRSLVTFLVSNRLFAWLFLVVLLMLGWVQLPSLKITQYPDINVPMLTLNLYWPGASPTAMRAQVVEPVEDRIADVRRVREVLTRIHRGFARVQVEFERGVDIDTEYTEVYARINQVLSDLPDDAEVVILKQNPTDRVVSFVVGLSAPTANEAEVLAAGHALESRLRDVDGLENVVFLTPQHEVAITLDLARMAQFGISVDAVAATLQQNNRFLPTGSFVAGAKAMPVLVSGEGYTSIDEIGATQVISSAGTAIALQEFAVVRRQQADNAVVTYLGNEPAPWFNMKLAEDANVFATRTALTDVFEQFERDYPGMSTVWIFDVEAGVSAKIETLFGNIVQGILILGILLLFAIGWRSAFIITTMLPVALMLSVIGLSLSGYGIQEISLAGFVIALGLIVDSGIVVTENAYKLRTYQNLDDKEAAIEGTASVLTPLASATATTALAFAPIFLLDSMTGLFLHSFVVTIWLCLVASLIAALGYAAILLARIGTHNDVRWLPTVPSFMNRLIPFRDGPYRRALASLNRSPWLFTGVTLLLLAGSLTLASRLEVIVFPDSDEPYLAITLNADSDRSTEALKSLAAKVRGITASFSEIQQCSTSLGATFPAVHTGIRWLPDAPNVGTVFCQVSFRDAARLQRLAAQILTAIEPLSPEADIEVTPFINGEGVDLQDIELVLSGEDVKVLQATSVRLTEAVRNLGHPGIADIQNPADSQWFSVRLKYREQAANALGVDRAAVDQVLVLLTRGLEVDDFRSPGADNLKMMLQAPVPEDPFLVLDRLFVLSTDGVRVPLSQVVDVQFDETEFDIYQSQYKPEVKVGVRLAPEASLDAVAADLKTMLADFPLAPGVQLAYGGKLAVSRDAFGDTGRYVFIIMLAILAIFVLQFNSVKQPLIVLAAIPLSFIGGFSLLWLTGQPLSFLAFVGLTSLMGIVINNSILLVDEGNRLLREEPGLDRIETAIRAGENRFMPVVLTTLTTIGGLLPLALGSSMFKPLAIVVIGGLVSSTVLTLLAVPVLYARLVD